MKMRRKKKLNQPNRGFNFLFHPLLHFHVFIIVYERNITKFFNLLCLIFTYFLSRKKKHTRKLLVVILCPFHLCFLVLFFKKKRKMREKDNKLSYTYTSTNYTSDTRNPVKSGPIMLFLYDDDENRLFKNII